MSRAPYRLGMHRVDGRAYWFAAYFNRFERNLMIRYAGQARADRFDETFAGRVPFAEAKVVCVFDPDPEAARRFADTFHVEAVSSLEDHADELDGVIVPFPAGGDLRDYRVVAPLVERGVPLFLDRIILEQTGPLKCLCEQAARHRAPLHVTAFLRYLAEDLLPDGQTLPLCAVASIAGEPRGYGADILDLVDELMQSMPVSILNCGDEQSDVLRIRYANGRHAIVQLFRDAKIPICVTALGEGWTRSLEISSGDYHRAAMRQFEAFLESLKTRQPPVPYQRVLANAAVLRTAEKRSLGNEIAIRFDAVD